MSVNYQRMYEKDYDELNKKYNQKSEEYKQLKYEYQLLMSKYKTKEKQLAVKIQNIENSIETKYSSILSEKDKEIERLKSLLNMDGTNAGISTSKTPIHKKKIVPNTRIKTGKKIGGQIGHKKHKLEKFDDDEVNDLEIHTLVSCPECGENLIETGEICKDELSFRFVPIKRRHKFITYTCNKCHKEHHETIPVRLKEENQYGSEINALAISLTNEGNVPCNKIRKIIKGFSHGEIDMSEGYIIKLQQRASKKLQGFKESLYKELLKQKLLYWDDTVIMVNQKHSCLRFYGTESLAYYVAHERKDFEGIREDKILNSLSDQTTVMHDHNKVNYNREFSYENIECNVHLLRDLEKCHMNTMHEWCNKLRDLIQKTMHERNERIEKGERGFTEENVAQFDEEFNDIILGGIDENKNKEKGHYAGKEMSLINRILEYKTNYFMWIEDFELPTSDNLSERALRGVKTKMKVSGQFQNIGSARNYADIKTYIETCYRNGKNVTDALILLMEDRPIKIEDILKKQ